jgi:hypothetical protein
MPPWRGTRAPHRRYVMDRSVTAEAALSLPGPEMLTMVHLIQAKRSPVIIGGVMAAVVASALVPLVVQFAGGGRSDVASIGATFRWVPVLEHRSSNRSGAQ